MMVKKYLWGLLIFLLLVSNTYFFRKSQLLERQYIVKEVIDGDSLTFSSGQKIRLANLDAPELGRCGSQSAKEKLEKLVLGKKVDLKIMAHDNMGRSLALVYLGRILVNEVLLKEGLARYEGSPSPEREKLKKAADLATENKKGIFSLCVPEKPEKPDCLIKGNIDRHDPTLKTYYFPGCSNYQQVMVEKDLGESWFCSEKEALSAGFRKSPNCFGKKY